MIHLSKQCRQTTSAETTLDSEFTKSSLQPSKMTRNKKSKTYTISLSFSNKQTRHFYRTLESFKKIFSLKSQKLNPKKLKYSICNNKFSTKINNTTHRKTWSRTIKAKSTTWKRSLMNLTKRNYNTKIIFNKWGMNLIWCLKDMKTKLKTNSHNSKKKSKPINSKLESLKKNWLIKNAS